MAALLLLAFFSAGRRQQQRNVGLQHFGVAGDERAGQGAPHENPHVDQFVHLEFCQGHLGERKRVKRIDAAGGFGVFYLLGGGAVIYARKVTVEKRIKRQVCLMVLLRELIK